MHTNRGAALLVLLLALILPATVTAQQADSCQNSRMLWADVVALDQPFLVNRLGASMPEGMVFALRRDVVSKTCAPGTICGDPLQSGNVMLRPGKRPRPIALRANVNDCITIKFTNLLAKAPAHPDQPATRNASFHIAGLELVKSIVSDGSFVGSNSDSTVPTAAPNNTIKYIYRATAEGTFLINSEGAAFGGKNQQNDGAQVTAGLFGAMNVQPINSEWYRSQVTHEELELAIRTDLTNGFSPLGQPYIHYQAKFPAGHPNAGLPILRMLDDKNNIIYTDLTAVITGPKAGKWLKGDAAKDPNLAPVNLEPNRLDPYREFTIGYHELMDGVQAFPIFDDPDPNNPGQKNILAPTLAPGADQFAINYGTGGIGAEILANRFGVGPMGSCADCRFEEFFLSAWTVGDPSMLVDAPANTPCSNEPNNPNVTAANPQHGQPASAPCTVGVTGNAPPGITPYRKATKAFFPDDPSNVYHSYINDRVKFRVLHTGTGVSHVHHLHAHQWVHSPNSDGSTYLDSQLINPGSAYTLEISHNGGGNRNKTVGDSIFHCHFYPHFAAGMWALWRTHDVYEVGSPFTTTKFPEQFDRYKGRALPDGEIAGGTPIPALIPMPTLMMPVMPGKVTLQAFPDPNGGPAPVGYEAIADTSDPKRPNPGFPFFIPGVAGTRAPHPPLDFAVDPVEGILDGGLPRHVLINARITNEQHTILNFSKDFDNVNAYELPEDGTAVEKVAMNFHAQCFQPSFTPEGVASSPTSGFRTNGLPAAPGAPYADPGLVPGDEDLPGFQCKPIDKWRAYKAAVIETDLAQNKKGWHYPQARYLTLWQDVLPNYRSEVAQEPLFIRANVREGVEYWHTNLVPDYYALDDYQVRTPTDIIGQHIHLVKFDVTASDGAVNGFNYEDGTFSYEEVHTLIDSIQQCGGLALDAKSIQKCGNGTRKPLAAKKPPSLICPPSEMDKAPCNEWAGAQTTVQRWYADPIDHENVNGTRTLRTVFTHDHFGPSTHQQTGLYAAFVVEPENSKWFQSETGVELGKREDGGPTTWNAIIESPKTDKPFSEANTYREFLLAMQDFQFAYRSNSKNNQNPDPNIGWSDPKSVIEPPFGGGLGGSVGPQIVSAGPTSGVTSFNYRNEPLAYRVAPPKQGTTGDPKAMDLAYVFASNLTRNDPAMNVQPTPGASIDPVAGSKFIYPQKPLTSGMQPGDPYTPLLRAFEGDRVQVRIIAGAHMLPHAFTIGGMKWLFEPSWDDSGWRSSQSLGISEHFEFLFETPRASPSTNPKANWTDYLYQPDASNQKHGLIDGTWGIFRAYKSTDETQDLKPLSTNLTVKPLPPAKLASGYSCPPNARVTTRRIQSRTPAQIIFNSRGAGPAGAFADASAPNFGSAIVNSFPMMYVREDDQSATEPLVVRVRAGECLALTLANAFSPSSGTFAQSSTAAYDNSNPKINLKPSRYAGLTAALMSFDAMTSTGLNVGFNPDQLVPIASAANHQAGKFSEKTYYWYAGQTRVAQDGTIAGQPIELGSVNLTPADPLEQDLHGLIGGLIVEPAGSIACADDPNAKAPTFTSVTVYAGGTCADPGKLLFREFVLITQDDLANVEWNPTTNSINGIEVSSSIGGSTMTAVNYRTEPMSYRFNASTNTFVTNPNIYLGYWNGLVLAEPQTPIFTAARGTPTRLRLLHPAGSGNQQVMALHGHVWQELPYQSASATAVSTSISNNVQSQYLGARDNFGTNMSYEIDLPSAGGKVPVGGDYLWRTTPPNFLQQGLWGLMRVSDAGSDAVRLASAQYSSGQIWIHGSTSVFVDSKANARIGDRVPTVALYMATKGSTTNGTLLSDKVPVVGANGLWCLSTLPTSAKSCLPFSMANLPRGIGPGTHQITAVSRNGGRSTIPLEVVAGLPQSVAPSEPAEPTFDVNRFVAEPRDHGEKVKAMQEVTTPPVLPAPDPTPPQP